MKLSPAQIRVLKAYVNRTGILAQETGMPVKPRSIAYALVRRGLAEWAACQYPSTLPAIRITHAGRAALEEI